MSRIGIATQRVLFLLDCTLLPAEDIQLNTRVFQWPKDMASVFDLAKTRTGHRRDQVKSIFGAISLSSCKNVKEFLSRNNVEIYFIKKG